MQETVDGPRTDRNIGVHDDDAASRLQDADGLIEKIPNVLKMVKGIKQHNVRKTALGKWKLLRIHDSVQPWQLDDICTHHRRRKLLEISCPATDFEGPPRQEPSGNFLIPLLVEQPEDGLLPPHELMSS